ncbi:hypothetical protein H4217_009480 [Coemansia sp. RSA 1939]|nr:hypothetical protein H4217_009480 [Coemansia sp. RSA 1939]KAJ2586703.1 hypothetical protein EV177_009723 [Coemansia sp. RSA 1804]KAJ2640912.1 hypothetical protein GGH99_009014 [Coemansia sp. RSA 1285]
MDSGIGSIISDGILLDIGTSLPLGQSISAPLAPNGRSVAGRIAGTSVDIGHGSSSTITLMHDDSGLESQDNIFLSAGASNLPPPGRPPPGMPGVARVSTMSTTEKRTNSIPARTSQQQQQQAQQQGCSSNGSVVCLPSNPPSTSGLSDADVGQLFSGTGVGPFVEWPGTGGDVLDQELEGLINFDC